MLPGMELMGCQDLAVPKDVMHHVVRVESSFNPYAIGVVGGRLVRQPSDLPEAVSTARMLEQRGYNFSLGLAQVNRYNLAAYGLDSYDKAFEPCANLQAGSRILAECYQRSRDWGRAFSCYYSGDFLTGFRHGYVQKIYASMRNGSKPGVVDRVQRRIAGAMPANSAVQSGQLASAAPHIDDGPAATMVARRSGQYARGVPPTALASQGVDFSASAATMPMASVSAAGNGTESLAPPAAPATAVSPGADAPPWGAVTQSATFSANGPMRIAAKRIDQGHPVTASQTSPARDSAFVF